MAEQIPYGLAESIISRLASAAFCEFGRIYGVMNELERLKNTVESIKAVLLDAEEKQGKNHSVQNWIRRLKDVIHPADDLLDEFFMEEMRQKQQVTEVFHSLTPKRIAFRHKMAHEIEKLRKAFSDVVEEMSLLNLSPNVVVVNQTDIAWRETSSFVLESDIVGRKDDKKKIVSLLRQPYRNRNVSLIAIVGIGGLGKTALAQVVYNDVEVKSIFDKRMWVCVSDNFDIKTIVKNMLESLISCKIDDKLSLDTLQNMLRENLKDKKYLLVLDDIWNESHKKWTELRPYLMCCAQDSKVLVTTRSKIVAQTMGISSPYVLNGLNAEESWSLLKNIVFGDDTKDVIIQTLEPIGKKIAKKCRGVPLAIRTLGGLLLNTSEESEWTDVLLGKFWQLCEDEDSIMPVLKLSYQKLSPQLRQCFAYCSLYPKDWEIEKDELIQLWMAQGYLECSFEKKLMENVGNQFVKIFLMKSFFQDAKMGEHGDIVCFKIHDLMHDLAMQVAGSDCCYLDSEAKRPVGRPAHVSLESNAVGLLGSIDASRLRTLILLPSNARDELNGEQLYVISNFKYLRVLKLSKLSSNKLSCSVEKLKHLRYLNLSNCQGLGNVSKSISNNVCLQTLILKRDGKVEFSTKDVSNLIYLRHLDVESWECSDDHKMPVGLGKLLPRWNERMIFSNYIVEISLDECQGLRYLPPLERLPFLKSLRLRFFYELECIDYYHENETFFPSLESLSLEFCASLRGWCSRMIDGDLNDTNKYCSHHLSSLPSFPCLSQLKISYCENLTHMPTFPSLDKRLTIWNSSVETLEATLKTGLAALSKLKSLHIGGYDLDVEKLSENWVQNLSSLEHLEIMSFSSQQFQESENWFKEDDLNFLPSLQKMTLKYCDGLMALPDWIRNLLSCEHIDIFGFELQKFGIRDPFEEQRQRLLRGKNAT